jgi:hypothetical protein
MNQLIVRITLLLLTLAVGNAIGKQ